MKQFSIVGSLLFAAAFGWTTAPSFSQGAPQNDSPNVPQNAASNGKSTPRIAKKILRLDLEKSLRPVEPARISGYGTGGYVEENGVFICDAGKTSDRTFGVAQRFELNQTKAKPVVATGWSKAEGVGGGVGSDYSLYIDAEFADGSMLWGATAAFSTGDSDWTQERVEILPEKPIKSLTLYGLFRNRSGKASFKEIRFYEANLPNDFATFDGVPIETPSIADDSTEAAIESTLQLRDVANNGDFVELGSTADSLSGEQTVEIDGLRIVRSARSTSGEFSIRLENLANVDRALTLIYATKFSQKLGSATWFDDPRRSREIESGSAAEYLNTNAISDVATGRLSAYPIGAISVRTPQKDAETAFGLGIVPEYPAFYRVGFCETSREFYVAVDLALAPEKPTAELRFWEIADVDAEPGEGFRAVLDAYRRAFPEAFVVRAPEQGNWMPFAKISQIPNWQDFGFKFKEGNDEPDWDDANGIVTFRYTEPMTWWQSLPKDAPKTLESAVAEVKKIAAEGNRAAQALLTSGMKDKNGDLAGLFLDTPWCDGVVWSMNDVPGLVKAAKNDNLGGLKAQDGTPYPAGFELKWSDEIADSLYPTAPKKLPSTRDEYAAAEATSGLDGEYIDSSEGYVTTILDFDRSHFAATTTPLVFDAKTKKPAIYRGLIAFEYAQKMAKDVRSRGKLMMANSTPDRFFWLAPQLDVLGTETNWNWNGRWSPMSEEALLYRRAVCGGKPYCFLMNTDFDLFTNEMVEKYMKRSLAYGMFPGFFSANASTKHYFANSELYERDRELFKKYLPLCQKVAQAGWTPRLCARSNDEKIVVEAFGFDSIAVSRPSQPVYLTTFNDSQEEKSFELTFSPRFLQAFGGKIEAATELTTGEKAELKNGKIVGKIGPEDVRVFRFYITNH